jgi:hypothetical protein
VAGADAFGAEAVRGARDAVREGWAARPSPGPTPARGARRRRAAGARRRASRPGGAALRPPGPTSKRVTRPPKARARASSGQDRDHGRVAPAAWNGQDAAVRSPLPHTAQADSGRPPQFDVQCMGPGRREASTMRDHSWSSTGRTASSSAMARRGEGQRRRGPRPMNQAQCVVSQKSALAWRWPWACRRRAAAPSARRCDGVPPGSSAASTPVTYSRAAISAITSSPPPSPVRTSSAALTLRRRSDSGSLSSHSVSPK